MHIIGGGGNSLQNSKKILLFLVKVNQHFRDHMRVHHQGSDMLTETVSPSQALVYSNDLVYESAKEYSV